MNCLKKSVFTLIFTFFLGTLVTQASPSCTSKASLIGTILSCATTYPLAKRAYNKACKKDPKLGQTTSFRTFYKDTVISLLNPKTAKKTLNEYPFLAHAVYITAGLSCFTGYSFFSDFKEKQKLIKTFETFENNITKELTKETPDFEKLKEEETQLNLTLERYIATFNETDTTKNLTETLKQSTTKLDDHLADYLKKELTKEHETSKKGLIELAKKYTQKTLAQNGYDPKALAIKQILNTATLNEKIFTTCQAAANYDQYEFIEEATTKKLMKEIKFCQDQLLATSKEYEKLEDAKQTIIAHDAKLKAEEEALKQEEEEIEQIILKSGNLVDEVTSNINDLTNRLRHQTYNLKSSYNNQTHEWEEHKYKKNYNDVQVQLNLLYEHLYNLQNYQNHYNISDIKPHILKEYKQITEVLEELKKPQEELSKIVNAPFAPFSLEPYIIANTQMALTKLTKELIKIEKIIEQGPTEKKPLNVQIISRKLKQAKHNIAGLLKNIPTKNQHNFKTTIQEIKNLETKIKGKTKIPVDLQMELSEHLEVINACTNNMQTALYYQRSITPQIYNDAKDVIYNLENTMKQLKDVINLSLENNQEEDDDEDPVDNLNTVIQLDQFVQINTKLEELNNKANTFAVQKIPLNYQDIFKTNIDQIKELIALLTKKETTKQQAIAKLRTINITVVDLNKKLNNPMIGYVISNDVVAEGKDLLKQYNTVLKEIKTTLICM